MTVSNHIRTFAITAAGLLASVLLAAAAQPLKIDFSNESVGAEPKSFLSVVGIWRIETDGGNKVLVVDGRQWKEGQASAGIAYKPMLIFRMSWPRTWTTFTTARSPSGSKGFPAASIKEQESCSTSSRMG